MSPLVSILIPAFNAQETIAETLQSAIAQTWKEKEIIVVDDGSTDQTLTVARKFQADGVRVLTQENQGAAAARNKAFDLSRGDYIQWLDADDLMGPAKISKQLELLDGSQSKRTLLSSAWAGFLYRSSGAEFKLTALWCDLPPVEWLFRKMGQNLYMQTSTWLVSRELTEAAGPWNTELLGDDDGEYFCRVLLCSDGVRFAPEARVYYRATGPGSLSYIGRSDKKLEAQWRSMQLHVRYLLSLEDSPRTRAACSVYLQNWMVFFYLERPDIFEEAEKMAGSLGGHLRIPRMPWKYSLINATLGRRFAQRAQILLPAMRWSLQRFWDKTLLRIEGQRELSVRKPN